MGYAGCMFAFFLWTCLLSSGLEKHKADVSFPQSLSWQRTESRDYRLSVGIDPGPLSKGRKSFSQKSFSIHPMLYLIAIPKAKAVCTSNTDSRNTLYRPFGPMWPVAVTEALAKSEECHCSMWSSGHLPYYPVLASRCGPAVSYIHVSCHPHGNPILQGRKLTFGS